ncbi:MAG: stage II sporulation protein M [Nitrososphaerota archaeon]|nr:stage II sporulation protein M [Nitrososphaerota archaeon]MDG7022638.1 stage II sporulation protein M [Nitrososphaerota archaeon]
MTSAVDAVKIIVGTRWRLILATFLLELAIVVVVSNLPFFPHELSTYEQQYNTTAALLNQPAQGQVIGIFLNNVRVAAVETIPALGVAVLGFSLYETARIIAVIGIVHGMPVYEDLATLFLLPSTWLELPAYALAATESIYVVRTLVRRGAGVTTEARLFVVNLGLIVLVLIVAAVFEVGEIQIEAATTTASGAPTPEAPVIFLTWVPFFVIVWWVSRFWRASVRDAPSIETGERWQAEETLAGAPVVITPGVVHYCAACGRMYAGSPESCAGCGGPLPRQPAPGT